MWDDRDKLLRPHVHGHIMPLLCTQLVLVHSGNFLLYTRHRIIISCSKTNYPFALWEISKAVKYLSNDELIDSFH